MSIDRKKREKNKNECEENRTDLEHIGQTKQIIQHGERGKSRQMLNRPLKQ